MAKVAVKESVAKVLNIEKLMILTCLMTFATDSK